MFIWGFKTSFYKRMGRSLSPFDYNRHHVLSQKNP